MDVKGLGPGIHLKEGHQTRVGRGCRAELPLIVGRVNEVHQGEGRDPRRYWPLSHIENWIPVLFALTYFAGFLAIILA